jgi:hypothetical protein
MCLFQLFVVSFRLEILLSLQEPAVALPTQEKIDFKTSKLLPYSGQKNKRFEDLKIEKFQS